MYKDALDFLLDSIIEDFQKFTHIFSIRELLQGTHFIVNVCISLGSLEDTEQWVTYLTASLPLTIGPSLSPHESLCKHYVFPVKWTLVNIWLLWIMKEQVSVLTVWGWSSGNQETMEESNFHVQLFLKKSMSPISQCVYWQAPQYTLLSLIPLLYFSWKERVVLILNLVEES